MTDHLSLMIVIVNWNNYYDTKECINSLLMHQINQDQIIVVDNGSKNSSVNYLKNDFPNVLFVMLKDNLGFAKGYNIGIKKAIELKPEWIFLLNNDTIVIDNPLSLISPIWDITVPKICFYERPDIIWAAGAKYRTFPPSIIMIGNMKKDSILYNRSIPLNFATGCALMVKREVLESIGGFNELYTSYMEDYEFSLQAAKLGYRIGYIPECKILHKVSMSLGETPEKWYHMGRNAAIFYIKNFSFKTFILHTLWIVFRESVKGKFFIIPSFIRGTLRGIKIMGKEKYMHV